jgi:mannose-6-phosphate isomerase-like protein (cupin superfamily)
LWGEQCDGWNLVDSPELSVKMERMPPHTAEQEHFHQFARQFFFILKGTAVIYFAGVYLEKIPSNEKPLMMGLRPAVPWTAFDTEEGRVELNPQEGLEIRPGLRHRIENEGEEDLEFILCSQPSTSGDRYPATYPLTP